MTDTSNAALPPEDEIEAIWAAYNKYIDIMRTTQPYGPQMPGEVAEYKHLREYLASSTGILLAALDAERARAEAEVERLRKQIGGKGWASAEQLKRDSDELLSAIIAFTLKGDPITADDLDMDDLPHLQRLVDSGRVVARTDENGYTFYEAHSA